MAFSSKPTGLAELATGGSINSSTLRAFIALGEGAGPPRELKSNSVGCYGTGYVNGTAGGWAGGCPVWTSGGFPYATGGADKTLKFGPNARGYIGLAGSGMNGSNLGTTRTMFVTFKVATAPINASHYVSLLAQGTGNGDACLTLVPYVTGGNQGAGAYKLQLYMGSSYVGPATDMIIVPGRWYTAALSQDDNGGTPNIIRNWWLYDWSTGQTYNQTQTGLTTTWNTGNSTNQLCLNISTSQYNGCPGLIGEIYCAGIDLQSWTSVNGLFTTYIGDPLAPARGSGYSSSSGTLTAGTAFVGASTATTIELGSARPTNGQTPYSYAWYRSPTANFTPPGSGTLVGTTAAIVDTPPGVGPWYYKCLVTDNASATVTSVNSQDSSRPQIHAYCDGGAPVSLLLVGDSITDNLKDWIAKVIYAATGAQVRVYNAGVQGGITALGSSVLSVHPGNYNLGMLGGVSSGTFTMAWNGNTTASIAYNASAANVQTALSALPGWGSVSCTGGPLPSSSIQIQLPAVLSSDVNPLTIAGSSLIGVSQPMVWVRSQVRLGADLLLADGGTLATIHLGANDAATTAGSAWNTAMTQIITYLNNRGIKAVLHQGLPRSDTSEVQTYNLQDYYLTQIPAIVAAINNPSKCVAGDQTLWALATRMYEVCYFQEAGRIHPRADSLLHEQALAQGWAVLRALGINVGAGGAGGKTGVLTGGGL